MRRVALKGLLGRKTRATLTALAIVLGVAMVSGTFVLTDTINRAFHTIFVSSYSHTDLVISGKDRVSDSASGNAVLPASLVASVQRLPDVREAKGTILNFTGNADTVKLLDREGKVIGSSDNPRFGFGIDSDAQKFSPFQLKTGRWVSGRDDVVIDADTAAKHHFGPGDTIKVSGTGPVRPFRVVGVTKFGDLNSLGGATVAIFTVPTARGLLDKQGFDSISVVAKPGVAPQYLSREIDSLGRARVAGARARGLGRRAGPRRGAREGAELVARRARAVPASDGARVRAPHGGGRTAGRHDRDGAGKSRAGFQGDESRADRRKGNVGVSGVDSGVVRGLRFNWTQGSDTTIRSLGADGAVVRKSFAKDHHLGVGGPFTLETPDGKRVRLTVAGIYDPRALDQVPGEVVISQRTFDRSFPRPQDEFALVNGSSRSQLQAALESYAGTKVVTREEFVTDRSAFVGKMLNLVYVLLALSVLVSVFGMVNTLVLSVFERTREFGMLRAVGMTRRQARRMVRNESVITALIGAAIGLPLGLGLAAVVIHRIVSGITYQLPIGSLIAFVIVAIVVGIGAAVIPAKRVSRLNVLTALQYE